MKKWDFHWSRQYSFFQSSPFCRQVKNYIKHETGLDVASRIEYSGKWVWLYSEGGSLDGALKRVADDVKRNPLVIREGFEEMHKTGQRFDEYDELWERYSFYLYMSFNAVEVVGSVFEEMVRERVPKEDVSKALSYYSVPDKKGYVTKISDYFKAEKNIDKRVNYLEENYPWVGSADPVVVPFTREQLREYASSFSYEHSEINVQEELWPVDEELISLYKEALYVKDTRDEYRRRAFYLIYPLMEELAERLDISMEDFWYVFSYELKLLKREPIKIREAIKKRKVGAVTVLNKGRFKVWVGDEAVKRFVHKISEEKSDEIKGKGCSSGVVKGEVQLIVSEEVVGEFKEGGVLVAKTTNVNYVTAMQKAVAFVTDEGGITCHAAIVARELNKPCVVGTRVATQALKDGDMVEVDADKGIVRKVSR